MIYFETSDWLKNAAVNGLLRILDSSEVPYKLKTNGIEVDENNLDKFEESYFYYFINTYSNYTSWKKIIEKEYRLENMSPESITEKELKTLNDFIDYVKTKLTSNSYVNTYPLIESLEIDLKQIGKQLKKISLKKNETIMDQYDQFLNTRNQLLEVINVLQHPEVKKFIVSRNIVYDVISNYWNSVSFLHVKANKDNMFEKYKDYFLNPLFDYLEEKKDFDRYSKYKYQCSTCNNKIANLSSAFDLTWLTKIGVDSARKSSHYWGYQTDTFICPECNFLYSCVPAGFLYFNRQGLFINENSSIHSLRSVNNFSLHHVTKFDELEDKGYFQIIDTLNQEKTKQANREIENIQIVKLNADNSLRPYTFNTLSRERLHVLQKNKNLLEKLIGVYVKNDEGYLNLYQEVTNRIYQNRKQFDLIYKLINLFLAEKIKFSSYIWIILLISNQSQRRGDKMNYKQIREFQQYGLNLREAYKGHENKLSGISYRLLNAAKVKNESRFMDTLLNAYMYQRKPVPLPFVEALNSDSRFQTIAYAFLLGLLGEQGLNKNNEEEDSDGK